ncbi:CocE/NonD family hydrolase [Actinoplanes sp. NPDC051851]|uniref:CocE/NonD family hydrolase n=1 Tax=Actinoplanes sp. NPDC051851 TaxID=3154753 RepID=UPI00341C5830
MPLPVDRAEPAPVPESATQHLVETRDGVRLATDVYLPADAPGPFPVALTRLPYDKNGRYTFMEQIAAYLTARGYAVVVQDVRGKFRSEGETLPFVHEAADGYDTIDWIVRQEWSDGRVGMFGDSYYGATQWAAVSSGHPALKAITPRVTGADGIRPDAWVRDGVMPFFGLVYYLAYWTDRHAYLFEPDGARRPFAALAEEVAASIGVRSPMLDRIVPETRPVAAYPFGHPFDAAPVPVLHQVAWFDNCLQFGLEDWTALADRPGWAPLQYFRADSTDHENFHLDDVPVPPELHHGENDAALARMLPRYLDDVVEFFDVFVKQTRDRKTLPRVRWHHGHDGPRTASSWPPPGVRTREWFLTPEALVTEAPSGSDALTWAHDPADLVPSLIPDSFSAVLYDADESEVHDRPDVLTVTTAPFAAPFDLAGPVTATLTVGTDGPSAHVYLKLCDVAPDGRARMLLRNQKRIAGGEPAPVTFDLTQIGYRVRPGHRLRLHVASSDFPLFLPHPGTGENPWLAERTAVTTQTLLTGGDQPSALTVTVLD